MGLFLAGAIIGAMVVWWCYLSARRENMRVDEEKQHLEQEKQIVVEFMHNLVEAIGEGVDRRQLFRRIVQAAVLSTGATNACIFERVDNKLQGVAVEGLFPPQRPLEKPLGRAKFLEYILRSEVYEMGEGLIGSVAKSAKAVFIEEASKDPRIVKHADPTLQVRSIIMTPILFRRKVLGVLAVANSVGGAAFNETDFSLVESLAEQAGMAIHNSDYMSLQIEKSKMDLDLSLASSVQGLLLPQTFPQIPALDIDACYQPAQKVGGDLYDVFTLGEDRVGIAIADVSGKGVSASLLMAICQTNLRHFARQYDSPAMVLRAVNQEMVNEIRQDMFITIVYAIVDTKRNQIIVARAGHELPLLFHRGEDRSAGKVEMIGSEGMAIGIVPPEIFDSVIEDNVVPFSKEDVFVLYTDGVTEATNQKGEEYSSARLAEIIEAFGNRSVADMNRAILNSVEHFCRTSRLADDITLISIKHI